MSILLRLLLKRNTRRSIECSIAHLRPDFRSAAAGVDKFFFQTYASGSCSLDAYCMWQSQRTCRERSSDIVSQSTVPLDPSLDERRADCTHQSHHIPTTVDRSKQFNKRCSMILLDNISALFAHEHQTQVGRFRDAGRDEQCTVGAAAGNGRHRQDCKRANVTCTPEQCRNPPMHMDCARINIEHNLHACVIDGGLITGCDFRFFDLGSQQNLCCDGRGV